MNRVSLAAVLGVLVALTAACVRNNLFLFGRVEGVVYDPEVATFAGELSGEVMVSMSEDEVTWLDLGTLAGIEIALQSPLDSSNVHGEQDLPVGTFRWVRLTFDEVDAILFAGSTVGSTTLDHDVTIQLGGADAHVEVVKEVTPFTILTGGGRQSILFNLNSGQWISESALRDRTVDDVTLQAAITVEVRAEVGS